MMTARKYWKILTSVRIDQRARLVRFL